MISQTQMHTEANIDSRESIKKSRLSTTNKRFLAALAFQSSYAIANYMDSADKSSIGAVSTRAQEIISLFNQLRSAINRNISLSFLGTQSKRMHIQDFTKLRVVPLPKNLESIKFVNRESEGLIDGLIFTRFGLATLRSFTIAGEIRQITWKNTQIKRSLLECTEDSLVPTLNPEQYFGHTHVSLTLQLQNVVLGEKQNTHPEDDFGREERRFIHQFIKREWTSLHLVLRNVINIGRKLIIDRKGFANSLTIYADKSLELKEIVVNTCLQELKIYVFHTVRVVLSSHSTIVSKPTTLLL